MKNFGKNLRKIRERRKWSQKDLSDRSGVAGPYIHQLETGAKNNPSINVVEKLTEALGVKLSDLTK